MLLVSAWQNICMDPTQGSNQTHQNYRDIVAAFYAENKTFISSEPTADSLSYQWSKSMGIIIKFREEIKVDFLNKTRYYFLQIFNFVVNFMFPRNMLL